MQTLPQVKQAQQDAADCGYFRSPNSETRWYAGRAGLKELSFPMELHIEDEDRPIAVYAHVYGAVKMANLLRFDNWDSFSDYLAKYGVVSEPGMPAFANSWD